MKFVPELLIALKTKDIAKLIEIYKDSTLQALYASYNADFQHDEQSQHYVLVASTSSSNLVKKNMQKSSF